MYIQKCLAKYRSQYHVRRSSRCNRKGRDQSSSCVIPFQLPAHLSSFLVHDANHSPQDPQQTCCKREEKRKSINLNEQFSFNICFGQLKQKWLTFVIIRGKHMVSVKPAMRSENISDLKTGFKWKLKHCADYLHRDEFHHHICSLPDLSIRQTRLENTNEMSIFFTSQNSCRRPWNKSSLLQAWICVCLRFFSSHVPHEAQNAVIHATETRPPTSYGSQLLERSFFKFFAITYRT